MTSTPVLQIGCHRLIFQRM